jgi:hypothetical protein
MESHNDGEVFYSITWDIWIDERRSAFSTFHKLLSDNLVITNFIQRQTEEILEKQKNEDSNLILSTIVEKKGDDLLTELLKEFKIFDISTAKKIYSQQCIVSLVSIYEQIIHDFSLCVLNKYPKHIYKFVNNSGSNPTPGKIDFMEIINQDDLPGIINKYAELAAEHISKSKQKDLIKFIMNITDKRIDENFFNRFETYINDRHEIVHELRDDDFSYEYIYSAFNELMSIVENLQEIALGMNIQVEKRDYDE